MPKIEFVTAREILDSRGNPTVQAVVVTKGGFAGEAKVPSGASTGQYEAFELRDKEEGRYGGKGVQLAVHNVKTEISSVVVGMDTANQDKLDRRMIELDGTPEKKRLGANAILAVSMAVARAEAASQGIPLYMYLQQLFPDREQEMPVPQMNLINGGAHASNGLSIQEFHVIPIGSTGFAEALRMGVEIHHALRKVLIDAGFQVELADEGGFAPKVSDSEQVLTMLVKAIEEAGYKPGVDAFLGMDAAANEFFDEQTGKYNLDGAELSEGDLAYKYRTWREQFPIISIEDPFADSKWEHWTQFAKNQAKFVQIIGDDLYASNVARIKEGITKKAANCTLVKPNQVGTLTETLRAILETQRAKHGVVISHRSGETEDSFIADLAVAVGAGQIKTGAPARSERCAKYNRLLHIEDEIEAKLSKTLDPYLANYKQPQ